MDGGKCILQLRGVRPFLSDKYDITKHPNFKYTADADDKNAFDIEAFLSARLNDNPGAKSQGMKQLMAGAGVAVVGMVLVPLLSGLFSV